MERVQLSRYRVHTTDKSPTCSDRVRRYELEGGKPVRTIRFDPARIESRGQFAETLTALRNAAGLTVPRSRRAFGWFARNRQRMVCRPTPADAGEYPDVFRAPRGLRRRFRG